MRTYGHDEANRRFSQILRRRRKRFKEKVGSHTKKTSTSVTTTGNYTWNMTRNTGSTAVWNLKQSGGDHGWLKWKSAGEKRPVTEDTTTTTAAAAVLCYARRVTQAVTTKGCSTPVHLLIYALAVWTSWQSSSQRPWSASNSTYFSLYVCRNSMPDTFVTIQPVVLPHTASSINTTRLRIQPRAQTGVIPVCSQVSCDISLGMEFVQRKINTGIFIYVKTFTV